MKITVCIGSSCHLKGARQVVEELQFLVSENNLKDKVELAGAFCMGRCKEGVSVKLDETFHSLLPETTKSFFETEVKSKI